MPNKKETKSVEKVNSKVKRTHNGSMPTVIKMTCDNKTRHQVDKFQKMIKDSEERVEKKLSEHRETD